MSSAKGIAHSGTRTRGEHEELAVVRTESAQVSADGFERGFVAGKALEDLVIGQIHAVGRQHRADPTEDARFPVDESPVAVERQDLEGAEVETHRRTRAG